MPKKRAKPLRLDDLGEAMASPGLCASILIVDDNAASSRLAQDALALDGYDVRHASDIGVAQRMLQRATPNLILMELALPGVDGLARDLKTAAPLKHVPIVALAGPAEAEDGESAYKAGFDGCIIKPLDTRKLPLQVAAFLVRGPARGDGL